MTIIRAVFPLIVYSEGDLLHVGDPIGNTRVDFYYITDTYTDANDVGATLFDFWSPLIAALTPYTVRMDAVDLHDHLAPDTTPADQYLAPAPAWGQCLIPGPMVCALYFQKFSGFAGPSKRGRLCLGPIGLEKLEQNTHGTNADTADADIQAFASGLSVGFVTPGFCTLTPVIYSRKLGSAAALIGAEVSLMLGVNRAHRPPL